MTGDNSSTNQPQRYLIPKEDVAAFLLFKAHYQEILAMKQAGFFDADFMNGKATINKHEGHIQSIYIEKMTYKYLPLRPSGSVMI